MIKRSKKTSGRGSQKPQRPLQVAMTHPKQVNGLELRHSVTLRFKVIAAANSTAISFQNLLDAFLVANTAIAGSQVFQTVRIRSVEVWGMPAIGATTSVAVEFSGITAGISGDQSIHTDTSMGIEPAHVLAAPSRRSLAADFQLSSGATAFIVSAPAGGVIDVNLSYRGQFVATTAVANALVGATAGAFYLRGLDGIGAGTNFTPEYNFAQI